MLIESFCTNCGEQLDAEWAHPTGTVTIVGAHAVSLRHKNGRRECAMPIRYATAYSIWDVNKQLERAEQRQKDMSR